MRRPALEIGVALVALGAVSVVESWRLRDGWLGARLMPLVIGLALVGLGAAHLAAPPPPAPPSPDRAAPGRAALMLALVVFYVAALPWAGFLPATAVFALIVVRWLGAYSWPATVAVTVAIAGASHVIFLRWLGMPLPAGPLGL